MLLLAGAIGFAPLTVFFPVSNPAFNHSHHLSNDYACLPRDARVRLLWCCSQCKFSEPLEFRCIARILPMSQVIESSYPAVLMEALGCVQIQMHIVQKKIKMWSLEWIGLQSLNVFCWCISVASAIGSVEGIYADTRNYTPFQTSYRR